jgi:hypothetical protein
MDPVRCWSMKSPLQSGAISPIMPPASMSFGRRRGTIVGSEVEKWWNRVDCYGSRGWM